jgi:hypothetical protein
MPLSEFELSELQRAYQTLGVPPSASALEIQQVYHQIAKQWRPDLDGTGSPLEAQAKERRKLITEAYELIEFAPLRYQPESEIATPKETGALPSLIDELPANYDDTRPVSGLEYGVRFVCGAFFGMMLSLGFAKYCLDRPATLLKVGAGMAMVFGLAAAVRGDGFWDKSLRAVRLCFRWRFKYFWPTEHEADPGLHGAEERENERFDGHRDD